MVNPLNEAGTMPDGEWVELYNAGSTPTDVNGWQIRDGSTSYFTINSSRTNTGSTQINPGGYLAVYRNMGSSMFNNDGDKVKIFDGSTLIDSIDYGSSTDGKSWSRLPNITGAFADNQEPTPGGPNV
jgi:hypothetical protein